MLEELFSQQPDLKSIEPVIPQLPPIVHLDNGVEVNTIPMDTNDLVAVTIMFKGGQWVQKTKLQSDFAMRQLRSGAGRYSYEVLNEKLDFYGATLTAGATTTFSFVQLSALKRTLPDILPILAEIISTPLYEQKQLEIGLEEGIFAHNVSMQKVAEVCKRLFYKKLLGENNPASQFADEEDYRKLTRESLLEYHNEFLGMSNAIVYLTGRVDDGVVELVNKYLGTICIDDDNRNELMLKAYSIETCTNCNLYETELPIPSVQSGLRIGKVLPDVKHEDYPAMLFFSIVLGGYFGCRLMKSIRERLGFTYGIGTTFLQIPNHNVFITATETPRKYVKRCVEEVKKDIIDLQNNPISDEEMALAKNYALGQFCRMSEVSYSLSTILMQKRSFGLTFNDWLSEQKKIQALTKDDIMETARKYFDVNDLLVSVAHGKSVE